MFFLSIFGARCSLANIHIAYVRTCEVQLIIYWRAILLRCMNIFI